MNRRRKLEKLVPESIIRNTLAEPRFSRCRAYICIYLSLSNEISLARSIIPIKDVGTIAPFRMFRVSYPKYRNEEVGISVRRSIIPLRNPTAERCYKVSKRRIG